MDGTSGTGAMRDRKEALEDGAACLEAALRYLAWGWAPIALCDPDHIGYGTEHNKKCDHIGKTPVVLWKRYQSELPTEATIRHWWHRWPSANVGIVMGRRSGLLGVDVDGERGEQKLAEVMGGMTVPTVEFLTPGGGRRLLFLVSSDEEYRITYEHFAKHAELRVLGDGSQTVVPPSRHTSGGYYRWKDQ